MTEYRDASIVLRKLLLNALGKPHSASVRRVFGYENDGRVLAFAEAVVDKARWLSSNEAVCTVNENGKITAIKEGYAEITVQTENGCVDILEVYVKEEGKANIYAMEKTEGGMLIKTGNYRNETVQVYTAFYDADGKLTGVAVCSVPGGEAGAVPIAEIPEGSVRAKSMMLSSEFRPLCKALEAGVMY